jgi:hypothetical protein
LNKLHLSFYKLFLLFPFFSFAQDQNQFKGAVFDFQSKKPLPFVHFIYEGNKGFISNEEGSFLFYSSASQIELKASVIGYESKTFQLKEGVFSKIYLVLKAQLLNEVVLTFVDPERELIKKVIENIPKNYPTSPEQIVGVTHEEVYLDSLYSKQSYKAYVRVLADKFSYSQRNKFGNIQILDQQIDWDPSFTPDVRFYAGIHNVHRFDFVMNKKVECKRFEEFTFHNFLTT